MTSNIVYINDKENVILPLRFVVEILVAWTRSMMEYEDEEWCSEQLNTWMEEHNINEDTRKELIKITLDESRLLF